MRNCYTGLHKTDIPLPFRQFNQPEQAAEAHEQPKAPPQPKPAMEDMAFLALVLALFYGEEKRPQQEV